MKKYRFLITTLFVLLNTVTSAQIIDAGLYICGNTFICVYNDTISMKYMDSGVWYKGAYKLIDNHIILEDNILLGKNASIEKEQCSPDSIKISFICKYQNVVLGAPMRDTTIYEGESDFYFIWLNDLKFESHDKHGIYITKEQVQQKEISSGFLLVESGSCLSGFQDYFSFPLEYGIHYTIKQKYYQTFHPLIINAKYKMPFDIDYDLSKKEITIYHMNHQISKYIYVGQNCDSCFNELKNRFPLLFE